MVSCTVSHVTGLRDQDKRRGQALMCTHRESRDRGLGLRAAHVALQVLGAAEVDELQVASSVQEQVLRF